MGVCGGTLRVGVLVPELDDGGPLEETEVTGRRRAGTKKMEVDRPCRPRSIVEVQASGCKYRPRLGWEDVMVEVGIWVVSQGMKSEEGEMWR